MEEKDKELLLKDLCARLPYGVMCYCKWSKNAPNGTSGCIQELSTFVIDEIEIMDNPQFECQICDVKPYLRPMSSMTMKEDIEYTAIARNWPDDIIRRIDWLNAHHFDYRNLIEKGIALEAPKGMYNLKKQ